MHDPAIPAAYTVRAFIWTPAKEVDVGGVIVRDSRPAVKMRYADPSDEPSAIGLDEIPFAVELAFRHFGLRVHCIDITPAYPKESES